MFWVALMRFSSLVEKRSKGVESMQKVKMDKILKDFTRGGQQNIGSPKNLTRESAWSKNKSGT